MQHIVPAILGKQNDRMKVSRSRSCACKPVLIQAGVRMLKKPYSCTRAESFKSGKLDAYATAVCGYKRSW